MSVKKIALLTILFLLFLPVYVVSQVPAEIEKGFNSIKAEDLKAQLSFIASDYTEGRETTSKGFDIAAKYVTSLFTMWGIKPGGDVDINRFRRDTTYSYFQTVPFEHIIEVEDASLYVTNFNGKARSGHLFNNRVDFSVSTSSSLDISSEVVFIGYGFNEDDFNEFKNVDLKNKIALMISGIPGETDKESDLYKKYEKKRRRWRWYREVIDLLREKKATGVLFAPSAADDIPTNINWNVNRPWRNLRYAKHYEGDEPIEQRMRLRLITGKTSETEPFRIQITRKVAAAILKNTGQTLEELQKKIDKTGKPQSFPIDNTEISIKVKTKSEIRNCKNIIGYVEGSDPKLKDELVIVGAHFDHLGKRNGMIWNGADDNGSGSVGVLEIAHAFSLLDKKPKRTVLFCLWTGEEHGLYGSRYFVEHPFKPLKNIVFYQNFDMIGRNANDDEKNKNTVSGSMYKFYPQIKKITEKNNEIIGLELRLRESTSASGGSDHAPFARKNIAYIFFITGMHPDYHQITDHVDKINFEKMEKIVKLGFLNLYDIANMSSRLKYDKSVKEKENNRR